MPTDWILYVLALRRRDLEEQATGSTFTAIGRRVVEDVETPLAPLAEQRRIVTKLEAVLADVSLSRERLARVSRILRRFRESVLAAATTGGLTSEWRERNRDGREIDATVDMVRRRREAEAKTGAQRERLRELFARSEEGDSEVLPDGWHFIALNKLCVSFDYGTSAKSNASGKVPVLRMGNIQGGRIDWEDLAYTSDEVEIENYSLQPNTVLFNRTNSPELVGKTAIYRGERPAIFAGYLIRVNPVPELDPEYLNLCLNTGYAKEFCLRVRTDGVSQSNINAQKLGTFEVPFCPLLEQREIVRRVDALFALADTIANRVAAATVRADRLTASILAKAFRGELVPTEAELARQEDRDYEPASALLERIHSDGTQVAKSRGSDRKMRATSKRQNG